MAKVTIVFEDEEDGLVRSCFESDPPFSEYKNMGQPATNAQALAYICMEAMAKHMRKENQDE